MSGYKEIKHMSTTQTQVRRSAQGKLLLTACKLATGYTQTKIFELCLALYALKLGREVQRAHEFLYQNLVQLTEAQNDMVRHASNHVARAINAPMRKALATAEAIDV